MLGVRFLLKERDLDIHWEVQFPVFCVHGTFFRGLSIPGFGLGCIYLLNLVYVTHISFGVPKLLSCLLLFL